VTPERPVFVDEKPRSGRVRQGWLEGRRKGESAAVFLLQKTEMIAIDNYAAPPCARARVALAILLFLSAYLYLLPFLSFFWTL